jgi:hypothetical protein
MGGNKVEVRQVRQVRQVYSYYFSCRKLSGKSRLTCLGCLNNIISPTKSNKMPNSEDVTPYFFRSKSPLFFRQMKAMFGYVLLSNETLLVRCNYKIITNKPQSI